MTLQIQQKKKKKEPSKTADAYSHLFQWAITELNKVAKRKADIINELADKLAKEGAKHETISTLITRRLKGIVGHAYISQVLPPEYKSPKHRDSAKANQNRSTNGAKQALPKTETEAEDTEQIVFQDSLDNLMSLPKYETDIDTMDLINCRRLLKEAIKRYREAKAQNRALNKALEQARQNPVEWAKKQKINNNAFGGVLLK